MLQHEMWLARAFRTLIAAKKLCIRENLLDDEDDTLDGAAYCTQQCAEKALKAYLAFKKEDVFKAYDLNELVNLCSKHDASFKELMQDALHLNPYLHAGYPDDEFYIDQKKIEEAIGKATNVIDFVKKKIEC